MEVLNRCCAGLDIHKKTVVACVRIVDPDGATRTCVKTFATMTTGLRDLADWLGAQGVRQVAMESTGVYWKPVWHLLEDRFDLMLVNAHFIKNVPGRKTDVKDAEWIAQLLQHGLLRPSFVPPPEVRQLRDLTRQRAQLVRARVAVVNRIQKVLEDANVKLASVATDVLGVSGRAMIARLIGGETDPEVLAELARMRLREKIPQLRQALEGRVTDHHRFQLQLLMTQVDQVEGLIAALDGRIEVLMVPFADAAQRLVLIPGVGRQATTVILAEIGMDMTQFPSAAHLASWAGLCPGNDQSAGKRRSGRTTKGSQWLRTTLVQVAWAASHTKDTTFAATYHRWTRRMGKKKALVAVAHKILTVVYLLLREGTSYQERGEPHQAA